MSVTKIKPGVKNGENRGTVHQGTMDGSSHIKGISPTSVGPLSSFYSMGPVLSLKGLVQRQSTYPEFPEEEEIQVQSKKSGSTTAPTNGSGLSPSLQAALNSGGGCALNPDVRTFMESRFQHDFNSVRIHSGPTASQAAKSIGATAFTVGNSIWFGSGQYQPNTAEGRHLLSHELAHTIQQKGRMPSMQKDLLIGHANDPLETAADRAADAVMQNRPIPNIGTSVPMIRCNHDQPVVLPVPERPNERFVDMPDGTRYRVVGNVRLLPDNKDYEVGQEPVFSVNINKENIWLQMDSCSESGTGVRVEVGIDVPAQIRGLLEDARDSIQNGVNPNTVLQGIDLNPYISIVITRLRQYELGIRGEFTIDPSEERLRRAGISIGLPFTIGDVPGEARIGVYGDIPDWERGIPGGITIEGSLSLPLDPVERDICTRRTRVIFVPQVTYTCFREHPAEDVLMTRSIPLTETRFVYFCHAEDRIVGTQACERPGQNRTESEIAQLNSTEIERLRANLQEGYRVASIRGYASPEGPQAQLRPGGFIGNDALSELRAQKARQLVEENCSGMPNCFEENVEISGEGELYTRMEGEEEVEGEALAQGAVAGFLGSEEEERHRTPELEERMAQQGSDIERSELVYPFLRRAVITLTKAGEEEYTVPGEAQSERLEDCSYLPEEAFTAAREDFEREQTD